MDLFSPAAQHAIAMTLKDIDDGWATLWGSEYRYDTQTGRPLAEPRREFGIYDRDERPNLPPDWRELFATEGLIYLDTRSNRASARWLVTDKGCDVMRQWLPEHLKRR